MSDAFISSSTKKYVVAITAPLYKNGTFIGVVGCNVELDGLIKTLSSFSIEGAYSILIDSKNIIIGHPNKDFVGKALLPELVSKIADKKDGLVAYSINGISKIFAYKISEETGWIPSFTYDKTTAYAFLDSQLKESIGFGALMILIAVAITVFIIRGLLKPLADLSQVVARLSNSDGDLRQRLIVKANDEFGQVSKNINLFIEKLHEIVKHSKSISSENASISEQLSSTAAEVVKNANNESLIIEDTTKTGVALVDSMIQSVQKAKESQDILEKTQKDISIVRNKAQELEHAMQATAAKEQHLAQRLHNVSNNANEVKEVLSMIRDIADQTNLLALNAAIEAARAGEHGRGFAVVADEVRKLAERTQKSLVEIDATINVVVQSIMDANTDIAENSNEINTLASISIELQDSMSTLAQIITKTIDESKESIENFADTSCKIEKMVNEMENINTISRENVASIGSVSSASEHLRDMTESLNNELGKFKS